MVSRLILVEGAVGFGRVCTYIYLFVGEGICIECHFEIFLTQYFSKGIFDFQFLFQLKWIWKFSSPISHQKCLS